MKVRKSISPAYSVTGGDKIFEGLPFEGSSFLELQIFYTGFNKEDNKIRLQESLDNGNNYVDSKDSEGNFIEITLASANVSDVIKVNSFNGDWIRARFIEGTTGVGTISKINFIME